MCSYRTSGASVRPLELGALPTAVPCARLRARHLVWEWGLNGLADSTELLVSDSRDQCREDHGRARGPSDGTPSVVQ
jgi:hypothetical protein